MRLKFPKTFADSLAVPPIQEVFRGALRVELQTLSHIIANLQNPTSANFSGTLRSRIPFSNLLFKPNETLNKFYELNSAELNSAELNSTEFKSVPASDWLNPVWPWRYIENPIGRGLLDMLNPQFAQRGKKVDARLKRIAKFRQQFL